MPETPEDNLQTLAASDARKSSRMRFSLGAVMLLITATSLALGLIRAIPLPEEFRQALLAFGTVWGLFGLLMVGPAWMRFADLRLRMRQRDARLKAWIAEKQRSTKHNKSVDM